MLTKYKSWHKASNWIHLSVLQVAKSHYTLRKGRNSTRDRETICSGGVRLMVWTLQGLHGSSPGTYKSCCRRLGSTPPNQSYSCCPHSPQTRREHSDASQAWSTNAPAWHDMGLIQHEPSKPLRQVHTGKLNIKSKMKIWDLGFHGQNKSDTYTQHNIKKQPINIKRVDKGCVSTSYLEQPPQLIQWW